MKHEIKILPEYFKLVATPHGGIKRFELRKNDRDYQVGDSVTLREWNGEEYTGNEITVGIKCILKDCPEFAFAMGEANRHKELKVFDWDRAAQLIKEKQPEIARAGLSGARRYLWRETTC